MTFKPHILSLFALMMFLGVAASCSKDSFGDPDSGQPAARPTMGITISLAGASSTRGDGDPAISGGYEIGEGLENYLDISKGNYRIYFFDTEGKYIDTFRPFMRPTQSGQEPVNGVQTVYYWQFLGEVPFDLPLSFKLVVLANWPKYPEEASGDETGIGDDKDADGVAYKLVKGKTTIKGLCRHADTQFSALSPKEDGKWLDESNLIPFYGVREYNLRNYVDETDIKDEKIDGDIYIGLDKDKNGAATALPLLRAMAKVEVILDNPLASFSAVSIDRVNAKGFCAPEKALNHSDYDHGYTWESDFIRGVHLTNNGENDASPGTVSLTKVSDRTIADGKTIPEKWVAYIPEYRNIDSDNPNGYCSIKVTLANPDKLPEWKPEEQTNTIYFATNGTKASNDNNAHAVGSTPGRYDIERNNIYRFTIKGMSSNLQCEVDVQPYADCPLTVDFGLMRDERGDLMVIPDSDGNLPQYFLDYMQNRDWPKVEGTDIEIECVKDKNNNDYYAIILPEDGDISKADVWVKDNTGCRVMTNFSGVIEDVTNDEGCSARQVWEYAQNSTILKYYKDKDGDQRLQHNTDHSSIVLHNKEYYFKTTFLNSAGKEEIRYFPVESWDEKTTVFWYLKYTTELKNASEEDLKNYLELAILPEEYQTFVGKNVACLTFQQSDKSGQDNTGVPQKKFLEQIIDDTENPNSLN